MHAKGSRRLFSNMRIIPDSILPSLRILAADVRTHEPLSKHTNFRLGGRAAYFIRCVNINEILSVYRYVISQGFPYIILGGGANVVFPDADVEAIVLQIRNQDFSTNGLNARIGAGTNTGVAVSRCLDSGFVGLEFLVGIYGTLGGSVRGNAGAFGKEMRDVVIGADILLPNGTVEQWTNSRFKFSYRDSALKHEPGLILTVDLHLEKGDVDASKRLIAEYTEYRRARQPVSFPCAGCMFKNIHLDPDRKDLREKFGNVLQNDQLPAWALIVEAGLAGKRIGDIEISTQHANFFINRGHGTAEHVVMLTSFVKQRVRDAYHIQLNEEVQFLGFEFTK